MATSTVPPPDNPIPPFLFFANAPIRFPVAERRWKSIAHTCLFHYSRIFLFADLHDVPTV